MKKQIAKTLAAMTLLLSMTASSCSLAIPGVGNLGDLLSGESGSTHEHSFVNKLAEEQYLKSAASCAQPAQYYYSCECGEAGEKSFTVGARLGHDYSGQVISEEYLKRAATCQNGAEYYLSCTYCGAKSYKTFRVEDLGDHVYDQENADGIYIKEEATFTSAAVYYKSCICGLVGTETFTYGEPLRTYTDEEKQAYMPTSLTVTLYDTETSTYGFTYNTLEKPLRPVIQIAKGETLTEYEEYAAKVEEASSYTEQDALFTYYIVKAEVELDELETYTYRAYDKYVDVGTETATLTTKDLDADTFTFAHVSDSQSHEGEGTAFGKVLANVVGNNDFILHTGDVVENSKQEIEWERMLDDNFAYLSRIPMMAISGNHETTYKCGSNETYKHFHNKIEKQDTELGYYYSFVYGNAKFIMLNTNRLSGSKLTSDQYNWLIDELENNTATWTFVALHNPLYSAGVYGSDPSRNSISVALRNQLQGIFAEYGVDVVLQGHDHLVSRTHAIDAEGNPIKETWETVGDISYSQDPDGVIYIMSGPAGHQTRVPNENMDASLYYYAKASNASSWSEFAIDGNTLTVTVKYVSGTTVSEYCAWGIEKSA